MLPNTSPNPTIFQPENKEQTNFQVSLLIFVFGALSVQFT